MCAVWDSVFEKFWYSWRISSNDLVSSSSAIMQQGYNRDYEILISQYLIPWGQQPISVLPVVLSNPRNSEFPWSSNIFPIEYWLLCSWRHSTVSVNSIQFDWRLDMTCPWPGSIIYLTLSAPVVAFTSADDVMTIFISCLALFSSIFVETSSQLCQCCTIWPLLVQKKYLSVSFLYLSRIVLYHPTVGLL